MNSVLVWDFEQNQTDMTTLLQYMHTDETEHYIIKVYPFWVQIFSHASDKAP